MRKLVREVLSPAYAHQTALVALALLAPAAVATFDLREAIAPMLVLWAAVALMALAVRRRELLAAAALGALLTASSALLEPKRQRALVAAFALLIAASVGLWARAAATPNRATAAPAFSLGRMLFAALGLFLLAGAAYFLAHERRNGGSQRRFLAASVQPLHFLLYWEAIVLFGTLLFPASAMPWVMLLILGALVNYSLADHCIFTAFKHWLLTGEAAWFSTTHSEKLLLGRTKTPLVAKLVLLFIIALVRYASHCRRR